MSDSGTSAQNNSKRCDMKEFTVFRYFFAKFNKMTQMYDKGHNNTTFLGDDGKRFTPAIEKNVFSLELSEKKRPITEDYEPYRERIVEHPTTNFDTFIHLLKGSLGTGILAMPNAFNHAGYIVGTIATIVIGFICTYCIHMLIQAEYALCKRKKVPSLNYPAVASSAILEGPSWVRPTAPYVAHIVNTFLMIYQLGTCCVYVVFVSSNIKAISDNYTEENTDIRLIMLIILLPLILLSWVRNLKYLAPFSTLANFVTIASFGVICYYLFREPISTENRDPIGELQQFPLFFGTVLFALEAIGVILPLENEMKTPKAFIKPCGVLNNAMVFIVFLYVGMGLFGYLNYGDKVEGSITLNLPADDILAQCVKGLLAFAIFITHGLACYVAIDIAWNDYFIKRLGTSPNKLFWEYLLRTALVMVTFLLAVAIPNLELFISLFGALCLSCLGLAFPAIIELCAFWNYSSGWRKVWMLIKNMVIIIIGLAGFFIGTYTSLAEIIETFS